MQSEISNFFKPSPSSLTLFDDDDVSDKRNNFEHESGIKSGFEGKIAKLDEADRSKVLNKKRNYAQLHLEVDQSNFLLRMCTTCGFKYAPGVEDDEKVHKTFLKNYTLGVPFKGWRNARIVDSLEMGRVILVQDRDPSVQQKKILDGSRGRANNENGTRGWWILDKHCKREIMKKDFVKSSEEKGFNGVILCKDEAVPAVCGIRAIWVTPSNRRKHVASYLLDALR